MSAEPDITIRHCHRVEEFRRCVELQSAIWQFEDRDLIPLRFFVVARKVEGQIIGAFDEENRMIGFCLSIPSLRGSEPYLHSHMLGVLAEHRRSGIGRRLKLEQRRDALERGIHLMEWTFDPLEWRNAIFNLNRLGAIVRRYVPDHYGISTSPLHRGLPTDRLIAEWWMDSEDVHARAKRTTPRMRSVVRRISMPLNRLDLELSSPVELLELQKSLREQFQQAFAEGLAVVGFEVDGDEGSYLLTHAESTG